MRSRILLPFLSVWVAAQPVRAADEVKPFAVPIEIRRFTLAEGLAFPKEFPDFLYAQLIEKLNAARVCRQVLGENEIPDPSLGESLVLEGKMLASKGAWYRGAGEKKITALVTFRRGSQTVFMKEITAGPNIFTRVSYEDENELWSAAALADRILKEVRAALKKIKR